MTDKATVEIASPRAGRVAKRMFAGGKVPGRQGPHCDRCGGRCAANGQAERARRGRAQAERGQLPPPRPATSPATALRAIQSWPRPQRASWRATSASTSGPSPVRGGPGGSPLTTSAPWPIRAAAVRRRRWGRAARGRGAESRSVECAGRSPRRWCGPSTRRPTSPMSRRLTAPSWSRCGVR